MTDHDAGAASSPDDPDHADDHLDPESRLRSSLASLALLSSRELELEQLLTGVAALAVRAIPGADGAGLTLIEAGRSDTIVASADFVTAVDDIQYGLGEGPCISAAAENRTIVSGSLGGESRWHTFGSRVARLGVHSVISLPLPTPQGVVGAMNVYAHSKHAFDERAAELGELFARPAAIAVQNAQVLARAQRLAQQLQSALDEQRVVDRAVGIMLSRSGGSPEEALDRLRQRSQAEHRKLAVLAQSLVDEAVRRVGRRHEDPVPGSDEG